MKLDRSKYDYRFFKVVDAVSSGSGKYTLQAHNVLGDRNRYHLKKKKDVEEWPSISNVGDKIMTKLCTNVSNNKSCSRNFAIVETTQGRKKKIWFFEGESVPYSKDERAAKKALFKSGKLAFEPKRKSHTNLVSHKTLGHSNPLSSWSKK